ncbi:MAG: YkgJ family cysteine cluster protein [Pseudomonadota bacterium]
MGPVIAKTITPHTRREDENRGSEHRGAEHRDSRRREGPAPPASYWVHHPDNDAPKGTVAALLLDIAQVGADTNRVARNYEGLFTRLRQVIHQAVLPIAQPARAAEAALAIADATEKAAKKAFPRQTETACRHQCTACCHLPVHVPGGVGQMIALYLDATKTPSQKAQLLRRLTLRAAHDKATQGGAIGCACPFLTDQGHCGVYPVRPPSCRAFTSPCAQRCHQVVFEEEHDEDGERREDETGPARSNSDENKSIDQNAIIFRIHAEANLALEQRAKQLGQKRGQEPLAAAVLRHWVD